MPYPFLGQLNQNEIFNALYNMIISIQTEARNINGTYGAVVDSARVDGTLYGDTKLYIDTNVLETHEWGGDAEAPNLLSLDRPANPETQSIMLNRFRQIRCTVDNILSKRAFYNEGVFMQFNGVLLQWIRDTKRVYDSRLYNTYIGTTKTSVGKQLQTISLPTHGESETNVEAEAVNRLRAEKLAQHIADLLVDMKDATYDYNDYGYLRSYADSDIKVIWNAKYVNEIRKLDLPTIFHKDGLMNKFDQFVLPSRYFGTAIASGDTPSSDIFTVDTTNHTATVKADVNKLRFLVEINRDSEVSEGNHYFQGDLVPSGVVFSLSTDNKFTDDVDGKLYVEDSKVICKVLTELPPFMSAFEVGTTFFNPRSHTENHYLTWGFNTLEYLKGKPFITISEN